MSVVIIELHNRGVASCSVDLSSSALFCFSVQGLLSPNFVLLVHRKHVLFYHFLQRKLSVLGNYTMLSF